LVVEPQGKVKGKGKVVPLLN